MQGQVKAIAGILHKQVKCVSCGELIWVSLCVRDVMAACDSCHPLISGSVHAAGNPFPACKTSDRQFHGECHD